MNPFQKNKDLLKQDNLVGRFIKWIVVIVTTTDLWCRKVTAK
jgi:hypothetical protein